MRLPKQKMLLHATYIHLYLFFRVLNMVLFICNCVLESENSLDVTFSIALPVKLVFAPFAHEDRISFLNNNYSCSSSNNNIVKDYW